MNYDFQISDEALKIPSNVYKSVKYCQYCQSVFLNEKSCESCGRSLQYHLIGDPFSSKSYYGIKERYVNNLNIFNRFFPFFENKKSLMAKSYIRKLEKRFSDLITTFNSLDSIEPDIRKLFFIENIELINELLRFGIQPIAMQLIIAENDCSLEGQALLQHIEVASLSICFEKPWGQQILDHHFYGILKLESLLKIIIITATVVSMAINYKEIISSQFGK